MCRKCYDKQKSIPKTDKESLYGLIDEYNNYNEVARILKVDKDTVIKWHRYYAKQDRENGIMQIASQYAPSRDELKNEIRNNSFAEVGRKYGNVGGNTVKKWCVRYCLPYLKSDIDNIPDEEWEKL